MIFHRDVQPAIVIWKVPIIARVMPSLVNVNVVLELPVSIVILVCLISMDSVGMAANLAIVTKLALKIFNAMLMGNVQ